MSESHRSKEEDERRGDLVALSVSQAAALVGLAEGTFRAHLMHRCPKFFAGRSVRIPRRLFEQYVEKLAEEEARDGHETAEALLQSCER